MEIRRATRRDAAEWLRLRRALWPRHTAAEFKVEISEMLSPDGKRSAFVAGPIGEKLLGFVEVSLREVAEDCRTRPVGYIEGWYVEEKHRRRGIGRALVEAAEGWVPKKGAAKWPPTLGLITRSVATRTGLWGTKTSGC